MPYDFCLTCDILTLVKNEKTYVQNRVFGSGSVLFFHESEHLPAAMCIYNLNSTKLNPIVNKKVGATFFLRHVFSLDCTLGNVPSH